MVSLAEKKVPTEEQIWAKAAVHFDEEAAKAEFDPFETVQDARVVRQIYDEKLGLIRYGALTYKESRECNAVSDKEERTLRIIYLMLKKAYPALTQDQVEAMPVERVARLGAVLGEKIRSFLPKTI